MQVKVWNDSDIDHVEEFRGKTIVIPAKQFVEMGRAEANKFISQFSPVSMNGAGKHVRPKDIRIEKPAEEFAQLTDQPLRYKASDGKMFRTKIGLKEYEESLGNKEPANEPGPRRRRKVQETI